MNQVKNKKHTNIASSENSIGFLPELCETKAILRILAGAQVIAFVLGLSSASVNYEAMLVKLGLTFLFVQSVVLFSALTICILSRKVGELSVIKISIVVCSIVVSFTVIFSILAIIADSYQKMTIITYWDTLFVLRNVFIALVLTGMALHYFYISHERSELSRAEASAQYDALQSRMKPHFLFNSLNSIAQLIHVDKNKAEDALLDLSDIFRTTLDTRNRISLAEELDVTKRYLNIETLRIGKRLKIIWDMNTETLPYNLDIPPLLLQPLVENAIHHGIQPCRDGGTLSISLINSDNSLDIVVKNPLPPEGTNAHQKGNHIAQENLRNRLKLAYGDRAKLKINKSENQYHVSFSIPKETDS